MSEIREIVLNSDVKEFVSEYDYKRKNNNALLIQEFNQAKQNMEKQRIVEEDIMSKKQMCSVSAVKSLGINIADLDVDRLTRLIHNQFYDPMVMKAILCVSESIFYSGNGDEIVPYNERIRDWFQDLRQIGQESVEGTAIRASLKGGKKDVMENDIFVIKAPRDPANMELLHEMFVGLQLNKLRSQIPNFSYVFGGFKCSPPIIDKETKDITSWCTNTKNSINYVVYEYVQPSIAMADFSKTCTFEQFCNRLLQICYSIDLAHKKLDFTHYDLHAGNVLDRKTSHELFYIPYTTDNYVTEYLLTDGIATIIDYGISHIKYEEMTFGDYTRQDFQVFPYRSFPISDIYKFLLMNMRYMYHAKNNDCFDKCRSLLAFFNNVETAESVLLEQDPGYFYMPYNVKTKDIQVMDFAKYVRIACKEYGISDFIHEKPREGIKVLGCGDQYSNDICYTNYGLIQELGVEKFDFKVDDIIQFVNVYEQISHGNYPNKEQALQKLMDNFDYNANFEKIISKLDKWYKSSTEITKNIKIYDISQLSLSEILSDENLTNNYERYVNNIIELYDLLKRREVIIRSGEFISSKYNNRQNMLRLLQVDNSFIEITNFYNTYVNQIFTQSQRILSEISKSWTMFQNAVQKNPKFEFWNSGMKFFQMTVGN